MTLVINIVFLIVDTIAGLLAGVLLLRFWMQAIRVRPPAQVAQFTFQLTDWLVRPLRRLVPGIGGYDWASLIGALLIVILSSSLMMLRGFGWEQVLMLAFSRLLHWAIYGLMVLLVFEAVFSWINPHAPLAPFVRALNAPLLRPVRRVVPPLGGLDMSLLVVLLLLQIALYVINQLLGPA